MGTGYAGVLNIVLVLVFILFMNFFMNFLVSCPSPYCFNLTSFKKKGLQVTRVMLSSVLYCLNASPYVFNTSSTIRCFNLEIVLGEVKIKYFNLRLLYS